MKKLILLILLFCSILLTQDNVASIFPSAATVLDSLEQSYNRIEDYYTRIEVSIKTPILRMPRKRVELWFKQPNLTKIETKGFAAIPKSGMISSPLDLFDNLSDIIVVGVEHYNEMQIWILQGDLNPDSLTFKNIGDVHSQPNLKMRLFVDRGNWTLIKSETWLDTTKVLEIQSEYISLGNEIYLPRETIINFEYSGGMPAGIEDSFGERHQFGGMGNDPKEKDMSGTITLKFSKYEVNKGLERSFFTEEESE